MSIKSKIAAVAASPFLFAGAAFAGPYVNLEATGSYPDGAYTSGGLEAVVGYEGATESGIGWYVSGGPTVTHTETTDEFGDVEFIGYLGGSYDKFYGEISGVTAEDDIDWASILFIRRVLILIDFFYYLSTLIMVVLLVCTPNTLWQFYMRMLYLC